ncbi:SEC-C domain-containing protein [bacterium]|nr:SEC-C domain-containing protein [bacterium]
MGKVFQHNEGVTEAERYLQYLCNKTFLSMWSYPGLFKSPGKELCDLLVVFDNHIIIFSDKYCKFPETDCLSKDWSRWYKRAIEKSVYQAWGAERWIKNFPERIFTDRKAKDKLPFLLPDIGDANISLIVVAHDVARRCAKDLGGSGSLMIRSDLDGIQNVAKPFFIGDYDKSKTFVHILDDITLNAILGKLDTIADFTSYLTKKEQLFRSDKIVIAAGEEDLLAHYLANIDRDGMHGFDLPPSVNLVDFPEGLWFGFIHSDTFRKQQEEDTISYFWDDLIDRSSNHAFDGTQYFAEPSGILSTERILRLLAKESRLSRRALSKAFIDLLNKTPSDKQATRYCLSGDKRNSGTTYVFMLYPRKEDIEDKEYREQRKALLKAFSYIAKMRIPDSKNIIGIATESGEHIDERSEDLLYLDASNWTNEQQESTRQLMDDFKLKSYVKKSKIIEEEYPDVTTYDKVQDGTIRESLNRNKPCPCGSGKKYKKCCQYNNMNTS